MKGIAEKIGIVEEITRKHGVLQRPCPYAREA